MEEIKKEEIQSSTEAKNMSKIHTIKNKIAKCACGNKKHFIAGAVLVLILLGVGGYYYNKVKNTDIGLENAKNKVLDFVNGNLLQPGTEAELVSAGKENGLYRITIKVGEQEVPTYLTYDGKKFFPQAMETEIADVADAKTTQAVEIPKTDKPTVELFVMSYCPYGTQMEKGILPVVDALGDKIDYSLKFVDYAMHGDKEIDENLRQYCIQKNQPTKLSPYLTCFLKKGNGTSDACLAASGISAISIKSCVAQTDAQFSIKKDAADKTKWSNAQYPPFNIDKEANVKYAVQGSPTLVINGVLAESGRDSAGILSVICGAFNNAPEACETQLSATSPAPGFGEGTATTADAASCAN